MKLAFCVQLLDETNNKTQIWFLHLDVIQMDYSSDSKSSAAS